MFRHELWSTGRTPPSHLAAANQPRNHWALWTFVVAGDLGSTYWLNAPRRGDDNDDGGGSMVPSSFNSSAILSSPLLSSFVVYPARLYSDLRSTGVSLRTYLVPNSASYVLTCPFVTLRCYSQPSFTLFPCPTSMERKEYFILLRCSFFGKHGSTQGPRVYNDFFQRLYVWNFNGFNRVCVPLKKIMVLQTTLARTYPVERDKNACSIRM